MQAFFIRCVSYLLLYFLTFLLVPVLLFFVRIVYLLQKHWFQNEFLCNFVFVWSHPLVMLKLMKLDVMGKV
jgi:hypothetical protein